jgi:hypothetical protein
MAAPAGRLNYIGASRIGAPTNCTSPGTFTPTTQQLLNGYFIVGGTGTFTFQIPDATVLDPALVTATGSAAVNGRIAIQISLNPSNATNLVISPSAEINETVGVRTAAISGIGGATCTMTLLKTAFGPPSQWRMDTLFSTTTG